MDSDANNPNFPEIHPLISTDADPEAESASTQARAPASSHGVGSRRRKVPDSVTPNACTNCKRARAKCDGAKPACKRCTVRRIPNECHYEPHAKTAKEQMVREIQRLQKKNESLEEEKDNLGEKNDWIEMIMSSLKEDGQGTEIIRRLKQGETHQAIAEWLGRPLTSVTNLSEFSELQLTEAIEEYPRRLVHNQDPRYWTNVTMNVGLIKHLIVLYLTWIHPVHMLFDENHFVTSFKGCSDTYCSAGLVNAICAMSCHLLSPDPDNLSVTPAAIKSLRDQFLKEARANMKDADHKKMTAIQTYAVMFLTEMGSGCSQSATGYLRAAAESLAGKHYTEQSRESEELAFWGVITLHTAWSAIVYQKPVAPVPTRVPVYRDILLSQADRPWYNYRRLGDDEVEPGDERVSNRPCYAKLTGCEHAKLYRIVQEAILVYCSHDGKVTASRLSKVYSLFRKWKEDLPQALRDVEGDWEALPHALFLHIQYNTALVNLFQPLSELEQSQDTQDYLRHLIIQHARQGLVLLQQYRDIYSCTYITPIQLFCTVYLCDALVRQHSQDPSAADTIRFCLESLQEAKTGYALAGPLQQMFRLAMGECNVSVPIDLEQLIGDSSQYGPEDFLNACNRISYQQPISQILPSLESDLGEEFVRDCQQIDQHGLPESPEFQPSQGSRVSRGSHSSDVTTSSSKGKGKDSMKIDSLLNS